MIISCKCGKKRSAPPWKDAREIKSEFCLRCKPKPEQILFESSVERKMRAIRRAHVVKR